MGRQSTSSTPGGGPSAMQEAEALLTSLTGVVSARVVTKANGEITEIHLLTTEEVAPKQTVRNVESALFAELGIEVDHRKISVAQTKDPRPRFGDEAGEGIQEESELDDGLRILFIGHQVEMARPHSVRIQVCLEWEGDRFLGEAVGADLARTRRETAARATLRALEAVAGADASAEEGNGHVAMSLVLDGVKVVEAFDRHYVLVAVHALCGRDATALAGSASVVDSPDRAVILATLQATDRWVRGHL